MFHDDVVKHAVEEATKPLLAEIDRLKRAFPYCAKHAPGPGTRGGCVICGLVELSAALSRIDYLCGEPNEMEMSSYDVHCCPQAVIRAAAARFKLCSELLDALKSLLSLYDDPCPYDAATTRAVARNLIAKAEERGE